MKKFNILFFTSGRSDFDLLLPIIEKFKKKKSIKLTTIVTGSHLSKKHGLTIGYIKKKNLQNIKKIKIDCSNVSEKNLPIIFGKAQLLYGKYFAAAKGKIHISVILGDRYEALSFAVASFFSNTPIAHIHGGEITGGAKDDAIRHAITKFSSLHFVSNEEHKKRVLKLGENPKNVFNCGLLGYENLSKIKFIDKKKISKDLKISFDKKTILVSYHSVTTVSRRENIFQFQQIIEALNYYKNFNIIFTAPNIDPGNNDILNMIKKFIVKNKNSTFFKSLGQELFFSLAKNCNVFIGNSSSGILEIPFLNVPVLNIGNRQAGRFQFAKILNINPNKKIIIKNINNIINQKKNKKILKSKLRKNTSTLIVKNIIKKLNDRRYSNLKNKIFFD
jgi:UDP-hydrolysing UDP-N-acetyl-D-glucosamine 2-epimerase